MPRGGSKKGERRGGRQAGTKNRATIEAGLRAAAAIDKARDQGLHLGVDILNEFANLFRDLALRHKQSTREFQKWARLAVDTARLVAPFQSPTFRAIEQPSPAPVLGDKKQPIRFGLRVFDKGVLVHNSESDDDALEDDDGRRH
jgi:hypothetical protein